jgi:alkyl hydroperoxide reductase subunit D
MTELETLRQSLPDFAKDIRLNIGTLLVADDSTNLSAGQKWGSAIAAATASRNLRLLRAVEMDAALYVDDTVGAAARLAAALMGMTNVYYRAVHMAADERLSQLPAGLRMNGLIRHGVPQSDFELFGLAASAIKGCEGCIKAHVHGAREHGVSTEGIQTVLKLSAVIHAAAKVLDSLPCVSAELTARPHDV